MCMLVWHAPVDLLTAPTWNSGPNRTVTAQPSGKVVEARTISSVVQRPAQTHLALYACTRPKPPQSTFVTISSTLSMYVSLPLYPHETWPNEIVAPPSSSSCGSSGHILSSHNPAFHNSSTLQLQAPYLATGNLSMVFCSSQSFNIRLRLPPCFAHDSSIDCLLPR